MSKILNSQVNCSKFYFNLWQFGPFLRYLTFLGLNIEKACRSPGTQKITECLNRWLQTIPFIKFNDLLFPRVLFKLNDLPCFYSREETYPVVTTGQLIRSTLLSVSSLFVFLCPKPTSSLQNSGLPWNWID